LSKQENIYNNGTYIKKNPNWHEEDSSWKATQIDRILRKNSISPSTICEIGCGSGEILKQLSLMYPIAQLHGYEISPQAFQLCSRKVSEKLKFTLGSPLDSEELQFDLAMAIDVFEHVEDYLGFLRKIKTAGNYKIFHIPLDLSVQYVLRSSPIMNARETIGHIHYFTKETALAALKDTGHEIVDHFYTPGGLELSGLSWKAKLMKIPRKLLFSINEDLTVRILGGYSMIVLAK